MTVPEGVRFLDLLDHLDVAAAEARDDGVDEAADEAADHEEGEDLEEGEGYFVDFVAECADGLVHEIGT